MLSMLKAVIQAKSSGKCTPIFVSFELTKHCNYSCLYCEAIDNTTNLAPLTLIQIEQILSTLKSNGAHFLHLTGGEPLLHPDIKEVILHAKSLGYSISLNTNGALLERLVSVAPYLDNVIISLDCNRKNNDEVRGENSFTSAIAAIESLKTMKVPAVISSVIHSKNIDEYFDFVLQQSHHEIPFVFQPLQFKSNQNYADELIVSDNDFKEFVKSALNRPDILKSLKTTPYLLRRAIGDIKIKSEQDARRIHMRINAFGKIENVQGEIEWNFTDFKKASERYSSNIQPRNLCYNSSNIREIVSLSPRSLFNLFLFNKKKRISPHD